jgi:hypothetical protein
MAEGEVSRRGQGVQQQQQQQQQQGRQGISHDIDRPKLAEKLSSWACAEAGLRRCGSYPVRASQALAQDLRVQETG